MDMPEVEERLGRLEVQMGRVEEDVREIKGGLNSLATEMRGHAEAEIERFHGLEMTLRNGNGFSRSGNNGDHNGNSNSRTIAMLLLLGKHVDRAGKWVIIGILAYFLKIITIDVDLPRLNKFVGTYEALNKAGSAEAAATLPGR